MRKALRAERAGTWSIDILVTDNRSIRRINKRHLSHDYATDVIAFDYRTPSRGKASAVRMGDLVVSAQMARQKARELRLPYREELARYLVHGTLHLLGYDDKRPAQYKKMHARQERILKAL